MNIWSVGHRRVVLFSTTPEKLVSGRHNHNEIMRTRTFVCRLLLVRVSVCVDYFHDGEPNPPDPSSWIDNVIGYGLVWCSFFIFAVCTAAIFLKFTQLRGDLWTQRQNKFEFSNKRPAASAHSALMKTSFQPSARWCEGSLVDSFLL